MVVFTILLLIPFAVSFAAESTPDDSTLTFVGDTQRTLFVERLLLREQNDAERRQVMARIASSSPAALVILGDLVARGADNDAWQCFDSLVAPVRRTGTSIHALPGNHDYFGDNATGEANFLRRFPHEGGVTWEAFTFRNTGILLLNSNFDDLSDSTVSLQQGWYQAQLDQFQSDTSIDAVIVCCHHAPFTNSTVVGDNPEVQRRFVTPFLANPKALVFFSGHCHAYERFREEGKMFIVSGGGGGPRQTLITDPARRRHVDRYEGGAIREFHFCRVTPTRTHLRVEMIRLDEETGAWSTGDSVTVPFTVPVWHKPPGQ